MTYAAEISRTNKALFLILIDQSGSMNDGWGGEPGKRKADTLATIVNRLLQNLVIRNTAGDSVKDRFDVGVIGYGSRVQPVLGGPLAGKQHVTISEIANNPIRLEECIKRVDDGVGGIVEQRIRMPIWVNPVADGGTPMCSALLEAQKIIEDWVATYPSCYPPIVMNITDGEATDGNPISEADKIRLVSSLDGVALLYNTHVSATKGEPIMFPDSDSYLPDEFAKMLFKMSSALPPTMQEEAKKRGYSISTNSKGFGFQGDIVSVIDFLDIGTRASNLR